MRVQDTGMTCPSDPPLPAQTLPRGSGPRLFCGHVPKEVTEDHVRAHFSQWGEVVDVYFPRHKKTLKRRPFCFVTFATEMAAQKALAETPMNICGMPIKNVTMVEDRDKYYQDKHAASQQALMAALQSMNCPGPLDSTTTRNLAAALAMEGVSTDALISLLQQQQQIQNWKNAQMISPRGVTVSSEGQLSSGVPLSSTPLPGSLPLYPNPTNRMGPLYPTHPAPPGFAHLPSTASTAPMLYTQGSGMSYGINMLQAATAIATSSGSFPAMTSNKSSICSMSDKYSASSTPRNSLEIEGHVGYAAFNVPGIHGGAATTLGPSIPALSVGPVSAADAATRVSTPFLEDGKKNGGVSFGEDRPADLYGSCSSSLAMQSEFYRRVPLNQAAMPYAMAHAIPCTDEVHNKSAFEGALTVQKRGLGSDVAPRNQNYQSLCLHENLTDKDIVDMSEPMSLTAAAIATAFSSNMDELQCSVNFTSSSAAATIENSGLIRLSAASPSKNQHSETWLPRNPKSVASEK